MHAMMLQRPGAALEWTELPDPVPGPGEIRVRVLACGVCRTDLHVSEGDLPVHRPGVIPGHEVVGEVVECGPELDVDVTVGDRVGIAWLRHTCGRCRFCLRGAENLCPHSRYTGWDADGGYAEFAVVPAAFAHRLPPEAHPLADCPAHMPNSHPYRGRSRMPGRSPTSGHRSRPRWCPCPSPRLSSMHRGSQGILRMRTS